MVTNSNTMFKDAQQHSFKVANLVHLEIATSLRMHVAGVQIWRPRGSQIAEVHQFQYEAKRYIKRIRGRLNKRCYIFDAVIDTVVPFSKGKLQVFAKNQTFQLLVADYLPVGRSSRV